MASGELDIDIEVRSVSAGQVQILSPPRSDAVASVRPSAENATASRRSPWCAFGRVRTTSPRSTSTTWMVGPATTTTARSVG